MPYYAIDLHDETIGQFFTAYHTAAAPHDALTEARAARPGHRLTMISLREVNPTPRRKRPAHTTRRYTGR
jgi:hypothetical protein